MRHLILMVLLLGLPVLLSCHKENPNEPPQENIYPQVDIPWPSLADSPWPIPYGNPQCTGRSKYPGPSEGKIAWIYTEEKMSRAYHCPVIGEDGTIYISDDQKLYAIHSDGTLKWKFTRGNMTESNIMIGAGDVIYFSTGSIVLDRNYQGYLYALDSNGNVLWEYRTTEMPCSYGSTLGIDGTIYFTDLGGYLHAVNADGSLKWETMGAGGFKSTWAIAISISPDGSTLYAHGIDSTMNAVNAQTGDLIWQIPVSYGYFAKIAPLVDNAGNVYFFANANNRDYVCSVNKNGEIRWKYTDEEIYQLAFRCGMHIDYDGNLYFSNRKDVYSLTNDGKFRWKAPLPIPGSVSPIIGDVNNNIYIACSEESVASFDQKGNQRFDVRIEGFGDLVNGALSAGRLYVGASCKLICIK